MQSFDALGAEDFIHDFNFITEFVGDLQEAFGQLGYVDQSDLEVLTQVRVVEAFESLNHELDDPRLSGMVQLLDDLLLALKVDGATHDD